MEYEKKSIAFMMTTSPLQSSPLVKKSLDIYLENKKMRNCIKWGSINAVVLSVMMYDINKKCPFAQSNWYYIEYGIAGLLALSVFYYFIKYMLMWFRFEPIKGTHAQKNLLHFEDGDSSFIVQQPEKIDSHSTISSPLDTSAIISWHSSFNDANRSTSNSMWGFNRSPVHQQSFGNSPNPNYSWSRAQNNLQNSFGNNISPNQSNNNSFNSAYKTYTKDEIITDEHGLQKYLREVAKDENNSTGNMNFSDLRQTVDRNSTSTLWNYWNNAANLLKTSIYQLSPTTMSPSKQPGKEPGVGSVGPGCGDLSATSDLFKTISSSKLTKYVTNLRMWLSATILQRLVKEFDKINNEFAIRGFSDIKIGSVGLERLKKTAENHMVSSYVPTLKNVLPFLEMSTNQEYLVQRIRELARGSGINDYRWNSTNSYDLNCDEHVTTDATIIFHLFCAYMDSQLNPLPPPGGRPFFHRFVVLGDKKLLKETIDEVKTKSKCAILYTNPIKPKFNFISDDKVHHCTHDRNNLFCVIIQFLIYMKEKNAGLLDGVNLGRSGLNILGVIED